MAKQAVSATIDNDLLEKLDRLAAEADRQRSWLIDQAIRLYLEELEDLKIAKERLNEARLTPRALRRALGV